MEKNETKIDPDVKKHLLELFPEELETIILQLGEKRFRSKQILNWIYQNREIDFEKMLTLSVDLRSKLAKYFENQLPGIKEKKLSQDGTTKYLLELSDGKFIEMVLIPAGEKNTLCISSQVGCARKCKFCATATLGFSRNLEVQEIVGQVWLAIKELNDSKLTNIVFMGMGEPLDNLESVLKAIQILQRDECFSFSPRRITISTCGVIPGIRKLADSGIKVKLAVSLNSAIQEKREELMPVTKQYPLAELKNALLDFRKKTAFRITFEYVMIKDFNMRREDIKALLFYLGDISCKLNIIKWNEVVNLPYKSPNEKEVKEFVQAISKLSFAVTHRKSRGADIEAACGQLAGKY
ncbi:MAG: 23S rRNA (adenine(2503)-C(2))-methyltransferase RlmN [Candidatus Cloacimonadota bacterium]|nr:MAG: 23S rRNA (adenine(2503)-C(2))-methyltransferase RlmN [Candidatus Cloacimonadota bacterium]